MRILIGTVQHPFITGGAEAHAAGLKAAIKQHGYDVDTVSLPFSFFPNTEIRRSIEVWKTENIRNPNNYTSDIYIPLKFPAWLADHPRSIPWVLHQHREVYELFQPDHATPDDHKLKSEITAEDTSALGRLPIVFANSKTVASRLKTYNDVDAVPLYHPPPRQNLLHNEDSLPFIFAPSRLETLKRQSLLIEAMRLSKSSMVALIAGEGGQREALESLADQYDLRSRVYFTGRLSEEEMLRYYARCAGVFFAPKDEDYGYVTLEAMLASKPVVTATDSGGPTELVRPGETGLIVEPRPEAVAGAIDQLAERPSNTVQMGRAAYAHYQDLDISWAYVVDTLIKAAEQS